MIDRRHALKTIAGATVIGSLSGCVQLATQRTTHFHGTPAMISSEGLAGTAADLGYFATAVGVEAHHTVERAGITREIVAHSWGMVYSAYGATGTGPAITSTFTTPSIEIAGRELNPVKHLTVGDIGDAFATLTLPFGQDGQTGDAEAGSFVTKTVDDATGKRVLRAFREATGGTSTNPAEIGGIELSGADHGATPNWDGDTYSAEVCPSGFEACLPTSLHFEKHDGDFMVTVTLPTGKTIDSQRIVHPSDDEFSRELLQRHLIGTNLRGAQGLVKQARTLVGETQELLARASNESGNEENEPFRVVSNTQDDLTQLDRLLGGVAEDLSTLSTDTIGIGDYGEFLVEAGFDLEENDTVQRITERSRTAADIAARAHDRVASHNDTRNEEDDRFVAIERNLTGLQRLTNLPGFPANWDLK